MYSRTTQALYRAGPESLLRWFPTRHSALVIHSSLCPLPKHPCRIQHRGAKTKTRVSLKDLPQGVLPALPTEEEEPPSPTYPPVIQQHFNHVQKFQDCVVLTRVGNFYELYGTQAEQYAPLLNLKVASRKTALGPVAMAGFQYFQLDRYLKLLVQDLNKQVAISEEIRNTAADQVKAGGLLYNRKVTRVITAGTLIDENFMDPYENNYLLSIHADAVLTDVGDEEATSGSRSNAAALADYRRGTKVGLTWVDLSSGDFFTQSSDLASLASVLARIGPREIVLDSSLEQLDQNQLAKILGDGSYALNFHTSSHEIRSIEEWSPMLDKPVPAGQHSNFSHQEIAAGSLLLDYVKERLMDLNIALRSPVQCSDEDIMIIDKQSLRGLEIRSTLREGMFQGSLLHAIRRTVTKSGARLLTQRLVSPSMSLSAINNRLDLVSEMLGNDILREDIVSLLRRTFDTLRLLQKFSIGRGDADDLLGLAKTIEIMEQVSDMLHDHIVSQQDRPFLEDKGLPMELTFLWDILERLDLEQPTKLAKRILNAIDEDSLSQQHEAEEAEAAEIAGLTEQTLTEEDPDVKLPRGVKVAAKKVAESGTADPDANEIWIMRRDASTTLQRSHTELDRLIASKSDLTVRLREELSANSLTLKWSAQLGHFCHVKGKDIRMTIEGVRTINSTKSTKSFYLPEWTDLGIRIDDAKLRIRTEEQRVFGALRANVIENLVKLRRNAAVLDELDVACSSATMARERNLVRPILHSGRETKIIGGRHPMVDVGLQEHGRLFTSNDCSVGGDNERIMLITGPNMAGKSTYLRQNALISILAQTGCFVPADYASIGLVDKIFSRVGSADNLYHHQSTFMVEMLEVAEILSQATPRSFVIMDEVGRGTTPEDGVAVGYACLHHLHEKIGARTLFATHFHALADMTRHFEGLGCWCTDVAEAQDGSWVYVHRLRRGVNRESHALKVARLAGLPDDAIAVAGEVLEDLKRQNETRRQIMGEPIDAKRVLAAAGS